MQFKILSEKHNPIFKRKEVVLHINYDGATPSKAALQQALAKDLKSEPNHVEISKILTEIGCDRGTISVKVWDEKEVPIYGAKAEAKPAEAVEAK
ncbi:MAG: hypothetical protein PHU12_00500 [Candidatus Aenigmarchaeota archaeon]|nr:hypothetical protein [Candidatus Aenigmarchaeota archaeon]